MQKFAIPMAEKLKSVSEADIEVMFGSLNELILANQTMLEALQQRQFVDNNMFVMHIGDILVDKLHVLGQYSVYCGNMRRASTRLRQLMQLDDVNEFLQVYTFLFVCFNVMDKKHKGRIVQPRVPSSQPRRLPRHASTTTHEVRHPPQRHLKLHALGPPRLVRIHISFFFFLEIKILIPFE